MWLGRCGANHCINNPNTRLLNNQFRHLRVRWHFFAQMDPSNITVADFIDDTMCERIPVHHETPFNYRGMCPWTYVSDTDENRYPMRLSVAKCRCSTCLDHFECKPVFYTMPVLKRVCRNGVNRWIQEMEYISGACYCIRSHTVRASRHTLN